MKKLIINADDFGMSPSVNRSIIECFKKGNITSATMLVNMPGSKEAAALAREHPDLDIGLHFCLTEFRPVTKCRTLVNGKGKFFDRRELIMKAIRRQIDPAEVAAEFSAQIEQARSFGIKLSHIDGHEHIQMNPWIFRQIQPVIESNGFPMRIVDPPIYGKLLLQRPGKFLKYLVLSRSSRKIRTTLKTRSNDSLVSIHDLIGGGAIERSSYPVVIAGSGKSSIVEVMVHPYIVGADGAMLYPDKAVYDEHRPFLELCEQEYRVLSKDRLEFDPSQFELTHYGRL